jgi:thiamine biosynthesis lipoprotein
MNTDIDLLVAGDPASPAFEALVTAQLLFEQQEQRFSRFRVDSLVSRLNRGETVEDEWLAEACRMANSAWEFTGGRFNPLILSALCDAGYDRSFEQIQGGEPRRQSVPAPGDNLQIAGTRVSLRDAQIDLGGIVKGWTVDLAIERLRERHANVFLNAGGDIRCAGREDGHDGWHASVVSEGVFGESWTGDIRGAMATSSTRRRRWRTADGSAHHIIDPSTGLPADSDAAEATVWADACWRAESWAKAIVIGGADAVEECRAAGLKVEWQPMTTLEP